VRDIEPLGPVMSDDPVAPLTMNRAQARFLSWTADVLIDVVVINLFVEYAPNVIIESFSTSLVTALLLKLLLDATLGLKRSVIARFGQREGMRWRVATAAAIWAILFLSKFVIIEVTAVVFGDSVQLGGFFGIVVLILAMLGARQAMGLIYHRVLGPRRDAADLTAARSASGSGTR
jgi:hypothetical protein